MAGSRSNINIVMTASTETKYNQTKMDLGKFAYASKPKTIRQSNVFMSEATTTDSAGPKVKKLLDAEDGAAIIDNFMDEALAQDDTTAAIIEKPKPKPKKPKAENKDGGHGKDGIFTPLVKATKAVMGQKDFNQFRGKVISEHSKVIASFTQTADSKIGQAALLKIFEAADTNGDGQLSAQELKEGMNALGF